MVLTINSNNIIKVLSVSSIEVLDDMIKIEFYNKGMCYFDRFIDGHDLKLEVLKYNINIMSNSKVLFFDKDNEFLYEIELNNISIEK